MRKIISAFLVLTVALTARAQYPGYKVLTNAEHFNKQFAAASGHINTIKSDFIQEKNMSLLAEKIISKGNFYFRKENAVRMEYTQPFRYLMILNGSAIYIKDSQKENKISARSNKLFQQINKIIIDCVNGKALQGNDFAVNIFEGGADYLAELSPIDKNLKTIFSHINIIIDKKDFSVSRIEMHEPSGDDTRIRFVNRQFNTPLADALFAIR